MGAVPCGSVGRGLDPSADCLCAIARRRNFASKISAIVQADLERSGQFKGVSAGVVTDETQRPDISVMRQKGADALLTGSISRMADGRYDVRVRLWDVVRGQDLGAMSYTVVTGDLRLASHRIADFVYENSPVTKVFSPPASPT